MSRARIGTFTQPSLVFGAPLSVIQPPDNDFEIAGNTGSGTTPSPDADFQHAIDGTLQNEIAALYAALREAQDLNQ